MLIRRSYSAGLEIAKLPFSSSRHVITLLILFLVVFLMPLRAQVSVLSASTASGLPGSRVPVVISLANNGYSITAVQFSISYSSSLLSIPSSSDVTMGSLPNTSHTLSTNITPGLLRVLISSDQLDTLKNKSGTLINISFLVSGSAALGAQSKLQFTDAVLSDVQGRSVRLITEDGAVLIGTPSSSTTTSSTSTSSTSSTRTSTTTTTSSTTRTTTTTTTSTTQPSTNRCDLNSDGVVNVLDIQIAVNRYLIQSGSADINCDGRTDVLDIQRLVAIYLQTATCPNCNLRIIPSSVRGLP
jgi:hypothetical protein